MRMKLKTQILISFLCMIVLLGGSFSLFGFFVVKTYIYGKAQRQVKKDIKIVRKVFWLEIQSLKAAFELIDPADDIATLKKKLALDYLEFVDREKFNNIESINVKESVKSGKAIGSSRIISQSELKRYGIDTHIEIIPTLKARPTNKTSLDSAMSLEYAKPFFDAQGQVVQVLYGGKVINKNYLVIDDIVDAVFESELYESKPIGTVTVFQDDVRIATNVLNKNGDRAIGTRVSEEVYENVITKGKAWFDRAFVVTDWYITAYEPIKNIKGETIGILYLGILEKPFNVIRRTLFLRLLMIIGLASLPTLAIFFFLANSMTQPLSLLAKRITKIAHGDIETKVNVDTSIIELEDLSHSFNDMLHQLKERERNIAESNEKLGVLNDRYINLIGFVSHELKGILASIVLNTYLLQKRILGDINERQSKVLQSMARNLDYLTVTVKNFLSLSRIEKDELVSDKQEILLREHIFEGCIESFVHQAEDRGMKIVNEIEPDLKVCVDAGLFQIVANNLISNAIKYGTPGGEIIIRSGRKNSFVELEVYNDGEPIAQIDQDKLFKKFSRIVYRGMEKVKGSGIGLFIVKEILRKHGGSIKLQTHEHGNSFVLEIPVS